MAWIIIAPRLRGNAKREPGDPESKTGRGVYFAFLGFAVGAFQDQPAAEGQQALAPRHPLINNVLIEEKNNTT